MQISMRAAFLFMNFLGYKKQVIITSHTFFFFFFVKVHGLLHKMKLVIYKYFYLPPCLAKSLAKGYSEILFLFL